MSENFVQIKSCKTVATKHTDGTPNGWLLELLSERDHFADGLAGQIYLTVVGKGVVKGYHIHALATYHVTCIRGRVRSTVYRNKNEREVVEMGEGDFKTIKYPPGCAHLITNIGSEDAYVIIYRNPAWNPDVHEQLDIPPEEIETDEAWNKIKAFVEQFRTS